MSPALSLFFGNKTRVVPMIHFVKDSWQELRQVNWLTRAQMIASTWLVIFLVAVFSLYVFVVDKVIQAVFSRLVS